MPYLQELVGEANEGVWLHYASGHFNRTEAMERLMANGLSEPDAGMLLDQPADPALFDYWKTWAEAEAEES